MKAKRNKPRGPRRHDLLDIDWQAVARGEIKLTKEQEAAAMDAWATQADAKAAQAAAKYSTIPKADRAKREAYLAANSGEKVAKSFCKGKADLILCHAKWHYKTKAEKLEYFRWVLKTFYSSPEYVFRHEIEAEKRKKDFEEYLLNLGKFKMIYHEEPDPWTEIESEIKRLAGPKPEKKTRKEQVINFEILLPPDKNPDYIFQSANLYKALGVTSGTFANWRIGGLKIKSDYGKLELQDWKARGYAVNKRTQNPILKNTGRAVVKKDIVEFFRITDKLPEKIEQK